MKFTMRHDYDEVMSRLFILGDDGRIAIGTARSCEPLGKLDGLDRWTLFSDYIMEGFVTYSLRLLRKAEGSDLEVDYTGTNRDQYIRCAIRDYITWAGLAAEQG